MTTTDYHQQAETFLARNRIKFRATLSDSKTPTWEGPHGHHYRVTLSKPSREGTHTRNCVCIACRIGKRPSSRLAFDFWGSVNDAKAGKHPSAYDVLACISSDENCPDTFEDFCAEYGYETDSIKALQTFRCCSRFAKRLREFFSPYEIEQLSEIQ